MKEEVWPGTPFEDRKLKSGEEFQKVQKFRMQGSVRTKQTMLAILTNY
jgi:hypothetical protein